MIGKNGVTGEVVDSVDEALAARELIKIRFVDHKDEKKPLLDAIKERTGAQLAGVIGHVAILYREHDEPEKRAYDLPPS